MAVAVLPMIPPIAPDAQGVLRVAGTRVTFDTIVAYFESGAAPEEIASRIPAVPLVAVYETIAYYLRHHPKVDDYLARRREQEARNETFYRAQPGMQDARARLLARRQA